MAWQKSLIISHGGASGPPTRFVTLTLAPVEWQPCRQKLRDLRRLLARRGYGGWEVAWTRELTSSGLPHVHALQKGPYVPQKELQAAWGAIVDIRAIRRRGAERTARYALKEAQRVAGYSLKEAEGDSLAGHLERNGGRLVHLSRGYLGGQTQEQVWADIVSQREADDAWVLVKR